MWQNRAWLKISIIILSIVLISFVLIFLALYSYAKTYENKVYPGVHLGQHHLAGMTKKEVKDFVESFNNRIIKEGVSFKYIEPTKGTIKFDVGTTLQAQDGYLNLITLDSDNIASVAITTGRDGNDWFSKITKPIYILLIKNNLSAKVDINDEFITSLKTKTKTFTNDVQNANLKIISVSPIKYEEVSEVSGTYFDYNVIKNDLTKNLSVLSMDTIDINIQNFKPSIEKKDLRLVTDKLSKIFSSGDISLSYVDNTSKQKKEWKISSAEYKNWMEVIRDKDNNLIFDLKKKEVDKYLESIKTDVEQLPKEAKFEMENGVVKKFQVSQSGIEIDKEKTYSDISKIFRQRNYGIDISVNTVNLSVKIAEPKLKMSDVNSLGISSIIGTGISSFKYSHTNRIKNIANAVKRLNGLLIKPDEIFSTNNNAGPYTVANGYLPEEVIVGDVIKIEVGGGMCQIGTTLFRMAMNSAMPITQRQNHSLVVQYYADPVNNNPGSDATVYEPYVDFKFKNDTGHYLLLQTTIDYTTQELRFTLWGTDDGRQGSYTHPVVSKWYSPGETIKRKTLDLKEGEEKCQNAFTGASASLTYTRITSSSEKIERVFDSYYRPLPKICMVGVSKDEFCSENKDNASCVDFVSSSSVKTIE